MNSSNANEYGNNSPQSISGFTGYLNSILVNLHGEMVPVPPLRNYADGAKDPDYFWFGRGVTATPRAWRAATHADHLSNNGLTTATLRVYAWDMTPILDPVSSTVEDDTINYVTVFLPGLSVSQNSGSNNIQEVDRLRGNSRYSYYWVTNTASSWQSSTDVSGDPGGQGNSIYTDDPNGNFQTGTFWAENYKPFARQSGVRIVFQGTTPTARPYAGVPN
jgi:hypothetical protein